MNRRREKQDIEAKEEIREVWNMRRNQSATSGFKEGQEADRQKNPTSL